MELCSMHLKCWATGIFFSYFIYYKECLLIFLIDFFVHYSDFYVTINVAIVQFSLDSSLGSQPHFIFTIRTYIEKCSKQLYFCVC